MQLLHADLQRGDGRHARLHVLLLPAAAAAAAGLQPPRRLLLLLLVAPPRGLRRGGDGGAGGGGGGGRALLVVEPDLLAAGLGGLRERAALHAALAGLRAEGGGGGGGGGGGAGGGGLGGQHLDAPHGAEGEQAAGGLLGVQGEVAEEVLQRDAGTALHAGSQAAPLMLKQHGGGRGQKKPFLGNKNTSDSGDKIKQQHGMFKSSNDFLQLGCFLVLLRKSGL